MMNGVGLCVRLALQVSLDSDNSDKSVVLETRSVMSHSPLCVTDVGLATTTNIVESMLCPATLGESSPLDDRSPPVGYGPNRQSPTLVVNHRPYPSVADRHTRASDPIPTFLG